MLTRWLEDWRESRRSSRELEQLRPADLALLAADVRLPETELYDLAQHGTHAADEMPQMMQALGLDAQAVARSEPELFRDMQRVCSHCENKERCNDELLAGSAAANRAAFCVNTAALDELAGR